jgi:hypothetical protein
MKRPPIVLVATIMISVAVLLGTDGLGEEEGRAQTLDAMQLVEGSLLDNLTNDSDGDFIFDERENALGTNPNEPDSDGDEFDDFFEDNFGEFGFDPLSTTFDTDADGLSDAFELSLGISPGTLDTDGDGWGDFDEVLNEFFGYHPLVFTTDADFDGLADSLEGSLGTSPSSADSDGDGASDFEEYSAGLDPATPNASGTFGELIGSTISPDMEQALEDIRQGGYFPTYLAQELPYPEVTEPPVVFGVVKPSAALMQRAVFNPTGSDPLYDSYNKIVRRLRQIAREFDGNPNPRIVRLFRWSKRTVDCCDRNGNNKPGRFLYGLKISDNPQNNEDELEILFLGTHHANELVTTSIAMGFIKELTDKYASGDKAIRGIVDNSEIWIIPVVNPDGYGMALGEQGRGAHVNWRKNTRRVDELTPEGNRQSLHNRGVDLNRNYGFEHIRSLTPALRAGLSDDAKTANGLRDDAPGTFDPENKTYAGHNPFSEVETRAVNGLADDSFATGNEVDGLECALSWHTAGGVVGHPMAHKPVLPGNTGLTDPDRRRFNALAEVVEKATSYENIRDTFEDLRVANGDPFDGYPVFGDTDDWMYKEHDVFELLVEAYSNAERGGAGPYFFPDTAAKRNAVVTNNVEGAIALVDACSPAEFGDADPQYPTKLADDGARHVDTTHEWFGQPLNSHDDSVSEEVDAIDPADPDGIPNLREDISGWDLDRFDDGVLFFPLTYKPGARGKVQFNVCVEDVGARYDPADPDKTLYLNAWVDWDTDFDWEEANNEHIIDGLKLAPKDAGSWAPLGLRAGATVVTKIGQAADNKCARYRAEFDVGATIGTGELWARFRLDYGEDVGRNDPQPLFQSDPDLDLTGGAARFGEVEDYLIGTDFGDAPDPYTGPNQYPTRKDAAGGRHLDFNREWLGPPGFYASATREIDGCDTTEAEEDRIPNLGSSCASSDEDKKEDGAVVPPFVVPGQQIIIEIEVSAKIDSFGYTNRGPGGEDSKGVPTLKPNCKLGPIPNMLDTPQQHRDRGRYAAWDPQRRLYLHVWADWDADGIWEDGELVISGPLDPEDWGNDSNYTLGEPFTDTDDNGVWTAGEAFDHVAGITTRHLICPVQVPPNVATDKKFWWRFRLDYGENVTTNNDVIHHATEDGRTLDKTRGGALWGEVEDYESPTPPHYKCYAIEPQIPIDEPVMLETQFGVEEVIVRENVLLCDPALKNGEGDLTQTPYKCYAIEPQIPIDEPVMLETQFGVEEVIVRENVLLCDPALKSIRIGGTIEHLVGGPDSPAHSADGSGSASRPYAAIAGGAAAGAVALAVGGWYARRRWLR